MVPVGGAIVAAGKRLPGLVEAVNKLYPGRAAVNAHLDLLMTLLHWGAQGWKQVGAGGAGVHCNYGSGFVFIHFFVLFPCTGGLLWYVQHCTGVCLPTTQELQLREAHFGLLHRHLSAAAAAVGERVLHTPSNPISMAMTLDRLGGAAATVAVDGGHEAVGEDRGERSRSVTFLGSMLWARWVPLWNETVYTMQMSLCGTSVIRPPDVNHVG